MTDTQNTTLQDNINEQVQRDPILQFFQYAHLPEPLQATSKAFAALAAQIVLTVPRNPERTVALRKLLEAKDCAVRATIWQATAG